MTRLRISEAAAIAIVEQADYYREQAADALVARWETAVDGAVRSLLKSPERGSICRLKSSALADLRWLPIGGFPKHMLFYRYSSEEDTVHVVHVLHGARDLEAVLTHEEEKE